MTLFQNSSRGTLIGSIGLIFAPFCVIFQADGQNMLKRRFGTMFEGGSMKHAVAFSESG
jgi:hypothetical protein